jgi:hypothetical protein
MLLKVLFKKVPFQECHAKEQCVLEKVSNRESNGQEENTKTCIF